MAKKSFYQNADNGRIVSKEYSDKHPKTTIKHTYDTKPKKK